MGQSQASTADHVAEEHAATGEEKQETHHRQPASLYPRYANLVKYLEIIHPYQVWVSDITYIRLQHEFMYLAIIMDIFTRALRSWCLSRTLDQELTLTALRAAQETHVPEIHHSYPGVRYAADAYTELLKIHSVQIRMAAVEKAKENGYAERVIRTIKEKKVDLSEYCEPITKET